LVPPWENFIPSFFAGGGRKKTNMPYRQAFTKNPIPGTIIAVNIPGITSGKIILDRLYPIDNRTTAAGGRACSVTGRAYNQDYNFLFKRKIKIKKEVM
jgi:hypothetical protein